MLITKRNYFKHLRNSTKYLSCDELFGTFIDYLSTIERDKNITTFFITKTDPLNHYMVLYSSMSRLILSYNIINVIFAINKKKVSLIFELYEYSKYLL